MHPARPLARPAARAPPPLAARRPPPPTARAPLRASATDDVTTSAPVEVEATATAPAAPAAPAPPAPPAARTKSHPSPRSRRPHPADGDAPDGELIPRNAFPRGARVAGRVVHASPAGLKVALVDDPRIIGFCAASELALSPRGGGSGASGGGGDGGPGGRRGPPPTAGTAVGDVREFIVLYVPAKARIGGLGPALSARLADEDVLWARAVAVAEACDADGDAVAATITGANAGGLLTSLAGLPAFVPFSQVDQSDIEGHGPPAPPDPAGALRRRRRGLDPDAAAAAVGATVRAIPTEVDRRTTRIILSPRAAAAAAAQSAVQVGGVVWGSVSRVEPYGAFVRVDGSTETALLHVSNVSRLRVPSVPALFRVGDRVRALVVGMDDDGGRVSLSTAEIEAVDGDMLTDAAAVYAGAEEQAGVFRAHLAALAAGGGGGGGAGRGARRTRRWTTDKYRGSGEKRGGGGRGQRGEVCFVVVVVGA